MMPSAPRKTNATGAASATSPQFTTKLAMFCATSAPAESAASSRSSSSVYLTTSPTLPNGDASLTPCPAMLMRAYSRYGTFRPGFPAQARSATASRHNPQRCAPHDGMNPQPTAIIPARSTPGPR